MAKIAILAGEPSGDLIASQLMVFIKNKDKTIKFIGVGGPLMQKHGLKSYFDFTNLSLYGFLQVIPNIPKLLFLRYKLIKYLAVVQEHLLHYGIHVDVTQQFYHFLKIAKFAKKRPKLLSHPTTFNLSVNFPKMVIFRLGGGSPP